MNWLFLQVVMILPFGLRVLAIDMNEASGVMPTDGERKVCEKYADGRELEKAEKDRPRSCHIVCTYDDGSEEKYDSPNNQLCCDMVGVGPTGRCTAGKCDFGRM